LLIWKGGQSFRLRGAPKYRSGVTAAARRMPDLQIAVRTK